jgi:hypothetical protein
MGIWNSFINYSVFSFKSHWIVKHYQWELQHLKAPDNPYNMILVRLHIAPFDQQELFVQTYAYQVVHRQMYYHKL